MKVGSLVECIANKHDHNWYNTITTRLVAGPIKEEISEVTGVNGTGINLAEYPDSGDFSSKYFREVQPPTSINIEELTNQKVCTH